VPKRIRKFSPGKINSQQIAESWLRLGIQPVPLKAKSKQPKSRKGWNKLLVTRDTIQDFFAPGDNIGGLWGEPSGWIIDVDLDWEEAAEVAPVFLPETFVYGRRSRPSTHYLYRCEGIATFKRRSDKHESIVEIRSTGSQSVLPPSIHPDDERYEINHDIPFRTIGRKQLEMQINWIAAAAMLIRNYPEEGGRHDYVHAITGTLLWSNWNEDLVRKFMEGFLIGIKLREDDIEQRVRTMENTIENYKKGNRIQGWRTLSQWLPGKVIELLKTWLTKGLEQSSVPLKVNIKGKQKVRPIPGSNDIEQIKVPGLVGDIAEWSSKVSFLKQPLFDLSVGLMCTAIATANKYVIDTWDTPLQPYFMLLAPTAAGKDSALDCVFKFARKTGFGDYVFQGFQSYHSMLDRLGTTPNMACWLWDEAARKLKSSGKSTGSPDYQVMTWLLSLYGRANSYSPGIPGRHQAINSIDHPFFTVLATAQPQQLMEAVTDTDVSTGLINRFVLFDVGEVLPDPNLERSNIFPDRIEEQVKRMKAIEIPSGPDPFIKVRMENTESWAKFRDFDTESRMQAFNGGGGEMWGRSNQNALIIAGIVAVGINPRRPMITEDIADWAITIARWSSERWGARVEESGSRSHIERRSKTVERYIRDTERYMHRARSGKMKRLIDRGLMPRGLLTQLTRHITLKDLDDVLNHLVISDLIATGEVDGVEVFWPKN
jgi:hypothetical protein